MQYSKKNDPTGNLTFIANWMLIQLKYKIKFSPHKFEADAIILDLYKKFKKIESYCLTNKTIERNYEELKDEIGSFILYFSLFCATLKLDISSTVQEAMKKLAKSIR